MKRKDLAANFVKLEEIDFSALIQKHGKDKIGAIKELRDLTGLGLVDTKAAIDRAYDDLRDASQTSPFKGGLSEALLSTLMPGEQIVSALEGMPGQGIVLTDVRVIIVKAGLAAGALFGQKAKTFRLQDITSVEYSCALTEGRIEISAAGTHESPQGLSSQDLLMTRQAENVCQFPNAKKNQFQALHQRIQAALKPAPQPTVTASSDLSAADILEQIRKLKELADLGAITQEEFLAKKTELLSRI